MAFDSHDPQKEDVAVIGIIPARYQSSRFPGKPLADILGKSLLQRTYENAKRCHSLSNVVVATDDKRIYEHVASFGGHAVMTSASCSSGTERVAEAAARFFPDKEIIINIQGDEPCLRPSVVAAVVKRLLDNPEACVASAAVQIKDPRDIFSASIVKCVFEERSKKALYFSRSPIPFPRRKDNLEDYFRHIGIFGFRRDFLQQYPKLPQTRLQKIEDLEQLKILEHGYPIHLCIVEDQGIGVDLPEDIKRVESYLCQENTSL